MTSVDISSGFAFHMSVNLTRLLLIQGTDSKLAVPLHTKLGLTSITRSEFNAEERVKRNRPRLRKVAVSLRWVWQAVERCQVTLTSLSHSFHNRVHVLTLTTKQSCANSTFALLFRGQRLEESAYWRPDVLYWAVFRLHSGQKKPVCCV